MLLRPLVLLLCTRSPFSRGDASVPTPHIHHPRPYRYEAASVETLRSGTGLTIVMNRCMGATNLEHYGDLTQIPSPQETHRHCFSYLMAVHNPL